MAKKILSILCALAMMVTMISVAAFSASAAETDTFAGFGDANVTFGSTSYSGQFTSDTYGDGIFPWQTTANVSFDENYNIGDNFSLSFYYATGYHGSTAKEFELTFNLGDLKVYVYNTGSAPYETFEVYYGETLLGTDAGTWGHYITTSTGVIPAIYEDMGKTAPNDSDVGLNHKVVTCTYKNGTITVTIGKEGSATAIKTITGTVADADFSDAAMTFTAKENGWRPAMMYKLSGTYAAATTGGEGGETPDPEAPSGDVNFNLLDSKNITGWTLTRSCPNTWSNVDFSGNIDLTSLTPELEGITGALVMTKTNSADYTDVTFDYNKGVDAIDFGENFSILMTAFMHTEGGTTTPNGDAYVSLGLGDYSIRLVHFLEDAVTDTSGNGRHSFRIAVYHGSTLVAVSDIIASDVTTSLYNGRVYSSNSSAWGSSGAYGTHIKNNCYGANQGTASGVSFKGDSGWKDIEIVVNDNKMTINTAAGVCGLHVLSGSDSADDVTTLSGFNTTYLDIVEGTSFDGISPQVKLSVDSALRRNLPIAVFRLEGTIYAPEDSGESTEPLAPTGVYPTLNSDLTLNVIYANAADYKDTVKVTATVEGMSPKTVALTEKDGYLVASFDFLTPDKFGSEITLNAVDTNGIAESYSTTYSVKQYCKNMMDKDSSSAELKALCMALLQFGDSYAVYKNGSTFLSDMSSYVTAYAPTAWTQGTAAWTYTGTANGAEWVGANLNFAGEIGINVNFKADGDASDYTVDASFGTVSDVIVDGDTFMATIRISSSFLSNQNEVAVKSAEGVISEVFTLSVEDWVNANIGKMEDAKTKAFVIALMTYGDAAAAYRN